MTLVSYKLQTAIINYQVCAALRGADVNDAWCGVGARTPARHTRLRLEELREPIALVVGDVGQKSSRRRHVAAQNRRLSSRTRRVASRRSVGRRAAQRRPDS